MTRDDLVCYDEGARSIFEKRKGSDMKKMPVTVTVDRPLGSYHPKHKSIFYPVNYGYIEGIIGGDGEEQDAYILGVAVAVSRFEGEVIARIVREDDVEEKWVVAPVGIRFTAEEIAAATHFQEQYFRSRIELLE